MASGRLTKAATAGAVLVVKYGPQAKIAWDKGGKQATLAAAKRAQALSARRKALNQARGVVDGSVLTIHPEGLAVYVVFSGDTPIAAYPPQETAYAALLEHADLAKRVRPDGPGRWRRGASRPTRTSPPTPRGLS
ncbi:MAG: hypothetical protein ABIQ15_05540 [Nocardioides sp.]